MEGERSAPAGSWSQSGWVRTRSGDHHTTGSLACCMNRIRLPVHVGSPTKELSWARSWAKRTVIPAE